jgi:predicted acylesterase/phospholipase RssA
MDPDEPLAAYAPEEFGGPIATECDIVMKGGVTSGIVYPYAILELARVYRFRSIGGTSAGAIAAAFAAAAEYARTARNDPEGFLRLQRYCERLPDILASLFQPTPRFGALMRYLLRAQSGKGGPAYLWNAPLAFWGSALGGLVLGAGLLALLQAGPAGVVLGAIVGVVSALCFRVLRLVLVDLPRNGFGLCSGLTEPGHKGPALTDWLHRALQDIAFGDPAHPVPLTFGELAGDDLARPRIDLRMVTTNLSMRRPHALPRLGMVAAYDPAKWTTLFPEPVMKHLGEVSGRSRLKGHRGFPSAESLPVIVAVRLSLSFPFLFQAVPMVIRDLESAEIAGATGGSKEIRGRTCWFSDGGLSSNFPIHLFDALLPSRPTFALSLDDLPSGARSDGKRVFFATDAGAGSGLPVHAVEGVGGFAMSVLGAAKDWQDQLLATMPGQRERIARVYLSKDEGGLNLTMPRSRARMLMKYGKEVGEAFANGALNFDEHRWRRTLVAYQQLAQTLEATHGIWTIGGYESWFRGYLEHPESYERISKTDRRRILHRIAAFTELDQAFEPALKEQTERFPRPTGRLRIVPNV